jgi:hypothetical protein
VSSGDQEETGGGRLLAGRYRVREQLGRGGMGVVWRAVDEVLGREVALKELRTCSDAAGSELADLSVRMQREARAAARVRHPGVVAVHDVTEVEGRPLIVMELVDGPSLDDVLRDRGPLDPREAAAIGAKVMDALAAAHRAGVLNAGTNYFYCQQNLGRRETYGKWTNVWWAKTDDDSGNTNVFVSDVYLKGGDNNAPLPGLPVC